MVGSYLALFGITKEIKQLLVVASGFEPPTPTMSRWCSNQLSYAANDLS